MHMPPSFKKETTIRKIARTYDQEQACTIYISDILKQRKTTSLAFKNPKKKFTNEIQILAL